MKQNIEKKICSQCGEEKLSTIKFFSLRNDTNKFRPCCKICEKQNRSIYYQTNKEKIKETHRQWSKNNKERNLASIQRWCKNNLERVKENKHKWYDKNKERHREQGRKWRQNNLDKDRKDRRLWRETNKEKINTQRQKWVQDNKKKNQEYKNKWKRNNPEKVLEIDQCRRARLADVPGHHTAEDIKNMRRLQTNKCFYCGNNFMPTKRCKRGYHLEHKIPLSRTELNPTNNPDNLCLSCPTCNLSKHNKTDEEFYIWLIK